MADLSYISNRMILACALALSAMSSHARADESASANPLRTSVVEPALRAPTRDAGGPLVEYGPLEAQAQEQARAAQEGPHASSAREPERERLPLGQPGASALDGERSRPLTGAGSPQDQNQTGSLAWTNGAGRTIAALAAVLGLIVVARWVIRRVSLRSGGLVGQLGAGGRAPSGVLEVLGRFPVGRGQSLVLLRLDRRVLLVSQSAQGFTTLTEIDDPQEVASLVVKTADDESASLAARFRSMLSAFERDPALGGEIEEVGGRGPTTLRLARQRREQVVEVTNDGARGGAVASVRRRLALLRDGEAA